MRPISLDLLRNARCRSFRKAYSGAAIGLLVTWLTLLTSLQPAHATMAVALDLAELVSEAEHVVVARVIQQQSLFDQHGRIVTDVQMQVERIEKGSLAPGASLTLRRLGGEVDGLGMRVEGEPAFVDGERVLLFGSNMRNLAVLRPVGMSQGAMRVYEENGEQWVKTANGGLTLIRKSTSRDAAQPVPEAPRKLSDVLGEIRSLVAQSKTR